MTAEHRRHRRVVAAAVAAAISLGFTACVAGQSTFNGSGHWSDPARWSAAVPNGASDDAALPAGTSADLFELDVTLRNLTWTGAAAINDTFGAAGTLTLGGTGSTASGAVTVDAATLRVAGGGKLTLAAGAALGGTGTLDVDGTLDLGAAATVTARTIRVSTLVSGVGTLRAGQALDWSPPTQGFISATIDVDPATTATLAGTGDKNVTGGLTNGGATTWSAGNLLVATGKTILNETGGVFEAAYSGVTPIQLGGAGQFTNAGTFVKSGSGTVQITLGGFSTAAGGAVHVDAGTLAFGGTGAGLDATGTVRVAPTATLAVVGGTHIVRSLDLQVAGLNTATVDLTGGALVIAGGSAATTSTTTGRFELGVAGVMAVTGRHELGPMVRVERADATGGLFKLGSDGAAFDVTLAGEADVAGTDVEATGGRLRLADNARLASGYLGAADLDLEVAPGAELLTGDLNVLAGSLTFVLSTTGWGTITAGATMLGGDDSALDLKLIAPAGSRPTGTFDVLTATALDASLSYSGAGGMINVFDASDNVVGSYHITVSSTGITLSTVPEPSAGLLAVVLAGGWCLRRAGTRRSS